MHNLVYVCLHLYKSLSCLAPSKGIAFSPSPLVPSRNVAEAFSSVMIINGVSAPGTPPSASIQVFQGLAMPCPQALGRCVCMRCGWPSWRASTHLCSATLPSVQWESEELCLWPFLRLSRESGSWKQT